MSQSTKDMASGGRFALYPEYEDSGVEWLGIIPSHWKPVPLKYLVRFVNGAPFKPTDWSNEGVPIIRIENLNQGEDFNCTTLTVTQRYHVNEGDLLFAWSGNRGTSFGPFLWKRQGLHYLNQHIFRLAGYHLDKRYFYWVLKGVTAYVEKQAHGIIGLVHITKTDLGVIPIPVVSFPEQEAIADFLDRETAKIDALVAKKRRLVELLEEKRTALISHAVTKGLDPSVPMKDSGVEWLGQIPRHWRTTRLKHLTSQVTVGIVITPAKYYVDEGIPCLRSLNVREGGIYNGNLVYISPESNEILRKSKIYCGDLVIVRSGQPGTTSVVDERFDGANCIDLVIVRRSKKMFSHFMAYLANSSFAHIQFGSGVDGAIQQHFNTESVKNLVVLSPPLIEQKTIVKDLDRKTAELDTLIASVNKAIDKLNEYRTALISAAVTGKIDVRGMTQS